MVLQEFTNAFIVMAVLYGIFFIVMLASLVVAARAAHYANVNRGILIWSSIVFAFGTVAGLAGLVGTTYVAVKADKVSETAWGKIADTAITLFTAK